MSTPWFFCPEESTVQVSLGQHGLHLRVLQSAVRTFRRLGQARGPLQAVGLREASRFSEEVGACPALCGHLSLPRGLSFLRWIWEDKPGWCDSPVCISVSSLLSRLASAVFENKLLFVLLRRGALGSWRFGGPGSPPRSLGPRRRPQQLGGRALVLETRRLL